MRAAVTGTFDGVHRGHRFLIDTLKREAKLRGLQPLAITFSCHPLALIAPEKEPACLTTVDERIKHMGVDVEVLDFDDNLRAMTAEEFLAMLRKKYGVTLFLLGFNNTIGSDRLGAERLAGRTVCGVEVIAADAHPALPVSSSAIRTALADGKITDANRMLGRPYALTGTVAHGKQLGRTIGFPTANIVTDSKVVIPAPGVYAGRVDEHMAVINIGRRPTVDLPDAPLSIEVHLLDFSGDLYGKTLTVEFIARLRDERKFGSLEELKDAIAADVMEARKYEQ